MWVKINNIGSQGTLVSKVFLSGTYDGYALGYSTDNKFRLHENGLGYIYYFDSCKSRIIQHFRSLQVLVNIENLLFAKTVCEIFAKISLKPEQ